MMQLINCKVLDKAKWDSLVKFLAPDAFFSYSWYLDAIAEDWSVFVDDRFTKGIAFATKKQSFFTTIYTPNFSRYSQFIGIFGRTELKQFYELLNSFSCISMSFENEMHGFIMSPKVYQKAQVLNDVSISSQAQRSVKKAVSSSFSIRNEWNHEKFYALLDSELGKKDAHYLMKNLGPLKKLIAVSQEEHKLMILGVYLNEKFQGAGLFIKAENALLYLKGICEPEAKINGAMHLIFKYYQEYCIENKLIMDFGGSNISGIRQFFMHYGGTDTMYYSLQKSTMGFRILKKVNQWIKKK